MKIAIINKYQNKVNRGAETFVAELSKRLSKNHQVDVLNKINFWKKYDLIIPTNGRLQVFIVRILTWLTGSKMIVSGQSGVGIDDRLNLYAMPDVFVALSNFAAEKSKKRNPFVKVVCIPNGVDLSKFAPQGVTLLSREKIVLSVGAFTEQKRHELVIKAVSKLKNVKLIIAGGGGDLKNKIYELGIKNLGKERFEIIETTNDKMPEIYRRASIFTLASKTYESFGIVFVEAMASGLPVVATDDPIRREIVGDAGLFVDPTDTDAYVKTIEKALNTDWGNKPRKQAEKFSWDIIAKSYEELFTELKIKK
ncbi:MAG: glycosyltransferase [uncultured bacterium]|nr:MAG: glycosyltransferase [uncultured bacterium]